MKAATIAFASLMLVAGVHKHDAQEHADAKTALGMANCSLSEAVTAALKELPDGKAVQAALLLEGADAVYEVEIVAGGSHMMVALDAANGQIKTVEEESQESEAGEEPDEDEQAETDMAANAKITLNEAIAAALKEAPGGKAFEAETERENDKLAFEIEVLSGDRFLEIQIDAMTGKVLEIEEQQE